MNSLTSTHNEFANYAMSNSDCINLKKIATFLQPFKNLTVKMSASSYSTIFMIISLFNIIIDHVEDTEEAAILRL